MLTGGCYCKAIKYEVTGRIFNATVCHCAICRGTSGAPCVAWFSVASTHFVVLAGTPASFRSSADATRTFRGRCGTQLTFVDAAAPADTDGTLARLDAPNGVAPQDHTFTSGQLAWLKLADGLPQYRRSRTDG